MARLGRCSATESSLLHKWEDLSSSPLNPCKKPVMTTYSCDSRVAEGGDRVISGVPAYPQPQWGTLSQGNKEESNSQDTQCLPLVSIWDHGLLNPSLPPSTYALSHIYTDRQTPHMQTCTHMPHTHKYTHTLGWVWQCTQEAEADRTL